MGSQVALAPQVGELETGAEAIQLRAGGGIPIFEELLLIAAGKAFVSPNAFRIPRGVAPLEVDTRGGGAAGIGVGVKVEAEETVESEQGTASRLRNAPTTDVSVPSRGEIDAHTNRDSGGGGTPSGTDISSANWVSNAHQGAALTLAPSLADTVERIKIELGLDIHLRIFEAISRAEVEVFGNVQPGTVRSRADALLVQCGLQPQ